MNTALKIQLDKFDKIQEEVYEWSMHNFGDQTPLKPFVGIAEEMHELIGAMSQEPDYEEDAIADIFIYMFDFTARLGIKFSDLIQRISENGNKKQIRPQYNSIFDCSILACKFFHEYGKMCHSVLKHQQGIRLNEDHMKCIKRGLSNVIEDIEIYIEESWGWDRDVLLDEIIIPTWHETVQKRDWKKNPETGKC